MPTPNLYRDLENLDTEILSLNKTLHEMAIRRARILAEINPQCPDIVPHGRTHTGRVPAGALGDLIVESLLQKSPQRLCELHRIAHAQFGVAQANVSAKIRMLVDSRRVVKLGRGLYSHSIHAEELGAPKNLDSGE